jgi:hypothetical protein
LNSDSYRLVKILTEGEWIEEDFPALKKGDIFKLYEDNGEYVGKYKALSDAYINIEHDIHEVAIEEVE